MLEATAVFKKLHKGKVRDMGLGKASEKILQQMHEMEATNAERAAEQSAELRAARTAWRRRWSGSS